MLKQIFILGLGLLAAACGQTPPVASDPQPVEAPITVETERGQLLGERLDNGSRVWRGVAYAADTAGETRWRAPQPVAEWDGVKDALEFAEPCAQIATPFTQIEGFVNWTLAGSEDCLAVDIYAPSQNDGAGHPVMFWIHGGSNVSGASQLYQGYNLTENENVVVVSVQYRLGPLGWFSHESLESDAANFALLDLVAALNWVQANIENFGGDPERVTIFGESAGGHNVAALLASPLAEGLFHQAILQSGGFASTPVADARGLEGDLTNPSDDIVERLGGPSKLRSVSVQDVFDAYEKVGGYMELPRMIQDGVTLPTGPLIDAFSDTRSFHAVPIITGTNKDELKLFNLLNDEFTELVDGRFYVAREQDFYDAASDYGSRAWRIRAVDRPATRMLEAGHETVYAYRFDSEEGGRFMQMDLAKMLGAAHRMESPFEFNRFKLLGTPDAILFAPETAETREKLGRQMGAYWASFARDGVPEVSDGPEWMPYGANASLLYFDSDNDGGVYAKSGSDTIERIFADLQTDERLDETQRCLIANGLAQSAGDEAEARLKELGCDVE